MPRHLRSLTALCLAVLVSVGVLAGCATSPPSARLPQQPVGRAAGDQLVLEPEHGIEAIYQVFRAARQRLDLTMYELDDGVAQSILAADADRGVRVRVVLDQQLERKQNQRAYDYLRAHGVAVVWANRRYSATHQKTVVVDGSLAVVMSLNLTARYYPTTRDVGILTTDPADVSAIEAVFDADFRGHPVRASAGDDLLWSPGSEEALVGLVDGARASIAVETEVISDARVVDALVRAAQRGVRVSVTMTYQKDWIAPFTRLVRAGAEVRVYRGEHPLYIHAKVIVVDVGRPGARAYLGSQNLSAASLRRNRELGVIVTAAQQVSALAGVLQRDAAGGAPWLPAQVTS